MTIDSGMDFLQHITPPCVPFISMRISVLTFIQSGAPNDLPGHFVNVSKRDKAAEVIQEIQKWKPKPFNFRRVNLIYDYIHEDLLKVNDTSHSREILWTQNFIREPRELRWSGGHGKKRWIG
jgi:son of sevenless-like protein